MGTSFVLMDDQIVRRGLRGIIEAQAGYAVVGEASSSEGLAAVVAERQPDIAVFEIAYSRQCGAEIIGAVRRACRTTRCLVLSTVRSGRRVRTALAAGVDAYVLKSASIAELLEAIETLRAGKVHLSPEIARCAIDELGQGGEHLRASPLAALSHRELEVMELVCEGQSTKGVAKSLGVSVKTADSHRYSMMKKLGIHNLPNLVRFAVREGVIDP